MSAAAPATEWTEEYRNGYRHGIQHQGLLMKALRDVLIRAGVLDPKSDPNGPELLLAAEDFTGARDLPGQMNILMSPDWPALLAALTGGTGWESMSMNDEVGIDPVSHYLEHQSYTRKPEGLYHLYARIMVDRQRHTVVVKLEE